MFDKAKRLTGSVEATFSYMTYIADINLVYGAVGINMGEIGSLGTTLSIPPTWGRNVWVTMRRRFVAIGFNSDIFLDWQSIIILW